MRRTEGGAVMLVGRGDGGSLVDGDEETGESSCMWLDGHAKEKSRLGLEGKRIRPEFWACEGIIRLGCDRA